jgi:hypothetical protein
MTEDECFVCMTESAEALLKPCKCTSSVHKGCLQRVIYSHGMKCTICSSDYDVQTRTYQFVRVDRLLCVIYLAFITSASLAIVSMMLITHDTSFARQVFWGMMATVIFMSSISMLLLCGLRVSLRQNVCCVSVHTGFIID